MYSEISLLNDEYITILLATKYQFYALC